MGAQLATNAANPYAPSLVSPDDEVASLDPKSRKLDSCRRTIKLMGNLYYVSGACAGMLAIGCFFSAFNVRPNHFGGRMPAVGLSELDFMMLAVLHAANAALLFSVGGGLQRLERKALWWARGLAMVNLISVPVGTLFSIFFLIQLFRPATKMLFDAESEETQLAFVHRLVGDARS
jgi:hypothetical protein